MAGEPGRVAVAMSGGVDSSVAAALLVEQGHDVVGVMARLWREEENRCCGQQAIDDAHDVAEHLGIPLHLVDYEAEFRARVVDHFVAEYSRGRTPNPCLACNRQIKFGLLLQHARALGADHLATGHYARVEFIDGRFRLRAGVDAQKDQSYVLYMLGQAELSHVLFPLGNHTKVKVRAVAHQRGLAVADKDESMEICFVADDDYRRFLLEHAPQAIRPGPIFDTAGRQIGWHHGLPLYTIGQRRGLGIAAPEALFVIELDATQNALIVGTARELGRKSLIAHDVRYVRGEPPPGPLPVQAKIRYQADLVPALWLPLADTRARVEFNRPLRDIAPGQAVVGYEGDSVLGGGTISE